MSLPKFDAYSDYVDFMCTLLRQDNACPVCHLPLVYEFPEAGSAPNTVQPSNDLWWSMIRSLMKNRVRANEYLFGTEPNRSNCDRCHYVAASCVPELSRPLLYQTPGTAGKLWPEAGMYLYGDRPRDPKQHTLVRYNMHQLFPRGIPEHRLMRLSNFLSTMGTRWFLACKDCNAAHTGTDQISLMVNTVHRALAQAVNPSHYNFCTVYTLMFDSLGTYDNGKVHVQFTPHRCKTWQVEVWLTYCTLMFVAQQMKSKNSAKYVGSLMAQPPSSKSNYIFHYAHRDMGICDFYMSQILSIVLYANHDISVDFITLHQRFMCELPVWAHEHGYFATPDVSLRCLWKFVMADANDRDITPIMTDPTMGPDGNYQTHHPDIYWHDMQNRNLQDYAALVVAKVTDFADKWLHVIGSVIDARNGTDPADINMIKLDGWPDPTFLIDLRRQYLTECGPVARAKYSNLPYSEGLLPTETCMESIVKTQSLDVVETIMREHFEATTPMIKARLYGRMVRLAMHRVRVGYRLAAGGSDLDLDFIKATFQQVLEYLSKLMRQSAS